jgi:hypothetical protein
LLMLLFVKKKERNFSEWQEEERWTTEWSALLTHLLLVIAGTTVVLF